MAHNQEAFTNLWTRGCIGGEKAYAYMDFQGKQTRGAQIPSGERRTGAADIVHGYAASYPVLAILQIHRGWMLFLPGQSAFPAVRWGK